MKMNRIVLTVATVGIFAADAGGAELPLSYKHPRATPHVTYFGAPYPPCVDRWGYVLRCAPRLLQVDEAYYNSTLPLEMTARWYHQPYRQHFTWGR